MPIISTNGVRSEETAPDVDGRSSVLAVCTELGRSRVVAGEMASLRCRSFVDRLKVAEWKSALVPRSFG